MIVSDTKNKLTYLHCLEHCPDTSWGSASDRRKKMLCSSLSHLCQRKRQKHPSFWIYVYIISLFINNYWFLLSYQNYVCANKKKVALEWSILWQINTSGNCFSVMYNSVLSSMETQLRDVQFLFIGQLLGSGFLLTNKKTSSVFLKDGRVQL